MDAAKRLVAGAVGFTALLGLRWHLEAHLALSPIYTYTFESFLNLGPGELYFLSLYLVVGSLGVAALAFALIPAARRLGPPVMASRLLHPGVLAVGAALLVGILGRWVLDGQVVTDDEYVYLFQARTLLTGNLVLPAPAFPDLYTNVFVVAREGRWFGQYPPGHPLLLAPATALGWPRLLPAILAGVNLWLIADITRQIAGTTAGRVAGLLILLSPFYLLTGSTLLSHPTALLGLCLASWGALRAVEHPGWRSAMWVGAGVGLAVVTRPWTGVTLGAIPLAGWLVPAMRGRRWREVGGGMAVLGVFGAGFLLYNSAVTGQPLVTGYQAIRGPGRSEFGFGTIVPGVHDHTLLQGLKNSGVLAVRSLVAAWGWPLALVPAAWAWTRRPASVREMWAVRGALVLLAVGLLSYIPYWSIGVHDTGPVKTYELLLPFGVLTAVGAMRLARQRGAGLVTGWLAASTVAAVLVFWPLQVDHVRDVGQTVRRPLDVVAKTVERPAVVFVTNVQPPAAGSWVFGRPNPRPDQSDDILYLRDVGAGIMPFLRAHPERHPYRLVVDAEGTRVIPLPRKER